VNQPRTRTSSASRSTATRQVVLVQTTIPDYRRPFFDELSRALGRRFRLLSGDEDWELDVAHSHDFPHERVRNVFLVRRRLLWQRGVLKPVLGAEVAILSLNPRILTSWIALVVRRMLGRRTLLWGHAWPRRGQRSPTERLRAVMRALASGLIVYTDTEAARLKSTSPRTNVVAAPNALYRRRELGPVATGTATDLVSVGRLAPSKRPVLLLEAFDTARPELSDDVRLVFVGDGLLRDDLARRIRSSNLEGRVVLVGHVSSPARLADIYGRAIASVTAGYVGLSLTQTLAFGVPMILPRHLDHGPEIEAAVEGVNAVFVEDGSATTLAEAIVAVVRQRELWVSRREEIAKPIRDRYSIESMVESFVGALRLVETTPHAATPTS
jgi:glycosyltransferase involved in cell wall biosynthesis